MDLDVDRCRRILQHKCQRVLEPAPDKERDRDRDVIRDIRGALTVLKKFGGGEVGEERRGRSIVVDREFGIEEPVGKNFNWRRKSL